ncbi:MAG: D-2-hydroxyacid dehydrogenase [Endozoicomonas sp.]
MKKLNAVILDSATLGDDVTLEPFDCLPLNLEIHEKTGPVEVAGRIAEAEILICNKVVITREHMAGAPRLKYIGVLATGMNNIDRQAAVEFGIEVRNVERYGTASVAQHTMAMMLTLANSLPAYSRDATNGTWAGSDMFCLLDHPLMELNGKTLLVIGYGDLGKEVARMAEAFGMKILKARVPGSSSMKDRVDLEEGLAQADVVSLHCPLTEQTSNLLDARRLSLMKPSALLVNTARGGLVNEQALVDALLSGKLGGAGFDVLTGEPPRNGNVLIDAVKEHKLPNLIITPHCAWGTQEARQRLVNLAMENLADFIVKAGQLLL